MTNTTRTTDAALLTACRDALATVETHRGVATAQRTYPTVTVRLPDGSVGLAYAATILRVTECGGAQDVPVRQGERMDLWAPCQLTLVA